MSFFQCPLCSQQHRGSARFCPVTGQSISGQFQPHPGAKRNLTGMLPPQSILYNHYMILAKVGKGNFGAVYKTCEISNPSGFLAIKEMSELQLNTPQERQQAILNFQKEAQILRSLNHPNIPKVVDYFTENHRQYIVMEFVDGQNLAAILGQRTTPYSDAEAWPLIRQLCQVLTYLHTRPQPIIFRDLKPENIMVTAGGQVKLVDFGITRFFKPGKTKDTVAMGTEGYFAEEALWGQTEPRSDQYSLCVVIHEMLTLHDPQAAAGNNLPLIKSLNPAIKDHWCQTIERGLQKKMHLRWPDISHLRQELQAVLPAFVSPKPFPSTPQVLQTSPPLLAPPTRRPTTRIVMAMAKLSSKQLTQTLGGMALFSVIALWLLTPILYEMVFIWTNFPLFAVVGPLGYAATRRKGAAFVTTVVLGIVGGMTIWSRTGVIGDGGFGGLIVGALVSGLLLEGSLLFLDQVRDPTDLETWKTEMAWLSASAVIATIVMYSISLAWQYAANPGLWFGAAFMGAAGWFMGDLIQQTIFWQQTGSKLRK